MTTFEQNNHLVDLAERVNAAVLSMQEAAATLAERALEAGNLLLQAKCKYAHGDWLRFLDRARIAERQAQRLMYLVRGGIKSDILSDLGMAGALDYARRRRLPESGQALVLTVGDPEFTISETAHSMWVWESFSHAGYYHVAEWIGPERTVTCTKRPIAGHTEVEGAPRIYRVIDMGFSGCWGDVLISLSDQLADALAIRADAMEGADEPWFRAANHD